ncbi:hypothetical protein WN48_01930 [Eufriesea mexicana]|uniref:Uncharacterized protein n=1 Tax=Eufriesea mexicana TaxID=516756 RepID=A0A310SKW4_9HYME|nr:hypothetical protein WN48_01930 [Eufriesea mexicana]
MSLLPVIDPGTIKQHCIAVNYENNSGHAAFVKTRRQTVTEDLNLCCCCTCDPFGVIFGS